MKKNIKFAILLIIISCFAGFILNGFLNRPKAPEKIIEEPEIFNPGEFKKNNITAETIIKGVTAENKIISSSVNLSCEIKIDRSYLDINILKKSQTLKFYGTALYTVNLENLSSGDIYFGENYIKIYIDKPELFALNLDAEKTIAEKIERGLLRFGEIKIEPEDYKNIQVQALKNMAEQLNCDEIKIITEANAKKAAADFFKSVLTALYDNLESLNILDERKNYNIEPEFK